MSFRSKFKSFESIYKVLGVETPLGNTLYRLAGEGIPVVLLPGETGQMAVQYRLFSALASHFQVLTWDWPEGVVTTEDALKTVEFLTDALISRPFWLMGAALGGTLGVIFAERYPERVQGLALTKLGLRPFDPLEKEGLEAGMDTLLQSLVKLEKLPRQVVLSRMHAQLRCTLLDRPP
ncbi:alpha/beta fold hydrolase [Eubacterium aggregans]|uniref:alpha/beta fold hydrolase n=1 Tax=Eubacterium aggregans TaxID=81409 RepID=UPI003F3AE129